MTKEEARSVIAEHLDHWRRLNEQKICTAIEGAETIKAFEMAIKALEQEPCEDWYDVPSNEMTLEQARQAVKDLRKKLAEYLEQEPKWIAVSERLPEKPDVYTVTDSKGDVVRFVFNDTESSREYWLRCAKAWMLIEPYREDGETE